MTPPAQAAAAPGFRWLALAALVFARTGIGPQFIAVAALMPMVRTDLALSYTQIGLLLGLFMVTGLFLAVPSAMIAGRLGDRRTLFLGLAAMAGGAVAASSADGFALLLAGRILGGMGAVFTTVTAAKILADWFHGREIATAMGYLGLSWSLGIAIGLSVLPALALMAGWRGAFLATAAMPVAAALLALALPRLGRPAGPEAGASGRLWSITAREFWAVLAGGLAWPLMSSGGYVVFSGYAPKLLADGGMGTAEAAAVISVLSWLFLVTIPLGGHMADRWGQGDLQFWLGCLISAAAIALVPVTGPVLLWVVLAAAMGVTVGPIMALPGQILSPASRSTGLGVFYAVYYGGTVALPALAGWLIDATGGAKWVVWLAAACLVAAPLPLALCRHLQRRWGLGR